ncbi:DUF1348 family protein [Streptomyces sp. NPDC006655]|uniref:DUF1348 family protein n=1 Tax=Streptomyces sp. NPDC006655 TaxID=3156898 RepID=UPI003453EA78
MTPAAPRPGVGRRHDQDGPWWRSYGNESWGFAGHGLTTRGRTCPLRQPPHTVPG